MKLRLILVLSVLCIFGTAGKSAKPFSVIYHDGNIEDTFSSVEDDIIPPRQEWFRVRSDDTLQPEARARPVVRDEGEIIQFSGEALSNTAHASASSTSPSNRQRQIRVNVNTRGRVGLQSQRGMQDGRNQPAFRGGWESYTETLPLSRLPQSVNDDATEGQQNWHLHIRHENGQQRNAQQVQMNEYEDSDEYVVRSQNIAPAHLAVNSDSSGQKRIARLRNRNDVDNNGHNGDDDRDSIRDSPPPHEQVAKMARYIVRNSNWTSMATISTMSPVKGYPFANVFSLSDGPITNSSGIPYMYMTPLDMSAIDLETDPRASLTMSLAQSSYCVAQQYDPEDPRCAHVILSGNVVHVMNADEIEFARNAMFSKHPEMQDWPKDHGWFFAKLDINHIVVLDYFGGAKTVTLDDYFNQSLL